MKINEIIGAEIYVFTYNYLFKQIFIYRTMTLYSPYNRNHCY